MIPNWLALFLIKQKNHNKRFGVFEFEYFGGSDVVNKLLNDATAATPAREITEPGSLI